MTQLQSKGEFRVGADFNPGADDVVATLKFKAADLIDAIEQIGVRFGNDTSVGLLDGEVARLKALAQTAVEEGAMWAVKAATKRPPAQVDKTRQGDEA